jgi:dipeptide/tripeptide permease
VPVGLKKNVQGTVDAATMNSLDGLAVLVFGYIYPFLQSKGIKLPTTYKFAIGSILGACAITYDKDGSQLCLLAVWQTSVAFYSHWMMRSCLVCECGVCI